MNMNGNDLESTVKIIGRTFCFQDILWCGLSGSGIEFHVKAKELRIIMAGDNTTQGEITEGKARFAIYINEKRVVDQILEQPEETFILFDGDKEQEAVVKIIKLSECAMSTMGIKNLVLDDDAKIQPLPVKELQIEFIGDSITCGYGIDLEEAETEFETKTEDVMKAYAYQTAKLLDADYSMVSFSGYGIISGYTDSGIKQKHQLVPSYYENIGFSYAKPCNQLELAKVSWDFSKYQPQFVVVNLGTNDDSYCQDDKARQEEFQIKYTDFLQTIRNNNPKAKILCTLGIMGGRLFPFVEEAVKEYQVRTGDPYIWTMKFEEQLLEDGYVTAYHPTVVTHEKAARKLAQKIRELLQ